jgi:hypothetical protein
MHDEVLKPAVATIAAQLASLSPADNAVRAHVRGILLKVVRPTSDAQKSGSERSTWPPRLS